MFYNHFALKPLIAGLFLLSVLLQGCADSVFSDLPENDLDPPLLTQSHAFTDSVILEPQLPLAFLGKEYTHTVHFDPGLEGKFQFDPINNTIQLEQTGDLIWNQAGKRAGGEPKAGIYFIEAKVLQVQDTVGTVKLLLPVAGAKQKEKILQPQDTMISSDLASTGINYSINIKPLSKLFKTFKAYGGFDSFLFPEKDLLTLGSQYLQILSSDSSEYLEVPVEIKLDYSNLLNNQTFPWTQMKLLFSTAENPLKFIPLNAKHDTLNHTFTVKTNKLGLFTVGIPGWIASNPRSYFGHQDPRFQFVDTLEAENFNYRVFVHDSIIKIWQLDKNNVRNIPRKDSLLKILSHLDSIHLAGIYPAFSSHDSVKIDLYITLGINQVQDGHHIARLPVFYFQSGMESELSELFKNQIFKLLTTNFSENDFNDMFLLRQSNAFLETAAEAFSSDPQKNQQVYGYHNFGWLSTVTNKHPQSFFPLLKNLFDTQSQSMTPGVMDYLDLYLAVADSGIIQVLQSRFGPMDSLLSRHAFRLLQNEPAIVAPSANLRFVINADSITMETTTWNQYREFFQSVSSKQNTDSTSFFIDPLQNTIQALSFQFFRVESDSTRLIKVANPGGTEMWIKESGIENYEELKSNEIGIEAGSHAWFCLINPTEKPITYAGDGFGLFLLKP